MIFQIDEQTAKQKARNVRMLLLDVDGVLTDGKLYVGSSGEVLKVFNSLDGHGIKMLKRTGIEVGIISGRDSPALSWRAAELGIQLLYKGREDKLAVLEEITSNGTCSNDQIAYAGDDLPDLAVMTRVGLAISVPNGHQEARQRADLLTETVGGNGAVREICDFLLQAQGNYQQSIEQAVDS
ncbi:MAG: HAD-IIIA family hydrolase [Gammaproteobacteria bacterium]|nr:HAD-IIIA family hydrolase [Pseudomonadales bacterium]MCP5345530.1 HAD-IIIA family hydrolase [Pseudomonadales bacterium]